MQPNSAFHPNTRCCQLNLRCPSYNRESEGGKTFSVQKAKFWNSLNLLYLVLSIPFMYIRYYNVMLSRSEGHGVIGVSCQVLPSLNKVSYLYYYSYLIR